MADDGEARTDGGEEEELPEAPLPTAEEEPMGAPTPTIFESALRVGAERLRRGWRLMLIDGVIAGLYISFSSLGAIALYTAARASMPDPAAWAVGALLYPVGYLFVIVGKSELFTENFLTPFLAAWHGDAGWANLLRLWGLTLVGNFAGIAFMAALWTVPGFELLTPAVRDTFATVAHEHLAEPRFAILMQAAFAGMLVNFMSWLVVAVRGSGANALFIFIPTYILFLLHLDHSVTGGFDIMAGLLSGAGDAPYYILRWYVLAIIGNVVGGLLFVTGLHMLEVIEEEGTDM